VYATRTKGTLAVIAPTTSNLSLLHMESREAASYRCSVIELQPQSVFLATVANAGGGVLDRTGQVLDAAQLFDVTIALTEREIDISEEEGLKVAAR